MAPPELFWPRSPMAFKLLNQWLSNIRLLNTSALLLLLSHPVVSDSLHPHGPQHARPLCPSLPPRVCSDSCPLSQWCHPLHWTRAVLILNRPFTWLPGSLLHLVLPLHLGPAVPGSWMSGSLTSHSWRAGGSLLDAPFFPNHPHSPSSLRVLTPPTCQGLQLYPSNLQLQTA